MWWNCPSSANSFVQPGSFGSKGKGKSYFPKGKGKGTYEVHVEQDPNAFASEWLEQVENQPVAFGHSDHMFGGGGEIGEVEGWLVSCSVQVAQQT